MKKYITITILVFSIVSCSKDKDIEDKPVPISVESPAFSSSCVPTPSFSFTIADEIADTAMQDSVLFSSNGGPGGFPTYYYHLVVTANNDGVNDILDLERVNFGHIYPDSSFLIIKDSCNVIIYDSKFSSTGIIFPPNKYASWNGNYAPNTLSYSEPAKINPEGWYDFEFLVYTNNSSVASILPGSVQLTRP